MDRHEEIKQLCVRLLNYYFIDADTEFTLYSNERVDVVGYYKNKDNPDIGIEVERTSNFQHDAYKLAKTSSFQLRMIVTEHPDTRSMGPIASINGKPVEIVLPPDTDIAFEKRIREFTNQNDRPWYNFREQPISSDGEKDLLSDFIADIQNQGLNVNAAKDIVFRAALGGIHFGTYTSGRLSMNYYGAKPTNEVLYLNARGLIFEDRPGRNYETGRQSVYLLSKDGQELALKILEERVKQNLNGLYGVQEKHGLVALLISLIGEMGQYMIQPDYSGLYGMDPYSSPPLLSAGIPRDLIEEFNIASELYFQIYVMANSPLFKGRISEIYKDLTEAGLGNKTNYVGSNGDITPMYVVPVRTLLRKLDVREGLSYMGKLKSYAEWVILRGHNSAVPSTLYDGFRAIGSDDHNAELFIGELAQQGITSKLVKGGTNTVAIYDNKRLNDFCEQHMRNILQDIFEKD